MIKKFAFLLFFVCAATTSRAEWVNALSDDVLSFYFDPSSARKTIAGVRMWELFDYKTDHKTSGGRFTYRSQLILAEYDCKSNRRQELLLTFYSGNMRTGESSVTDYPPAWAAVAASGTPLSVAMNTACGSAQAQAEARWVQSANDLDMGKAYIDERSVLRSNGSIKFSLLFDLKKQMTGPGNTPFRSAESIQELDCEKQVGRTLYAAMFAGEMGRGAVVPAIPADVKWSPRSSKNDEMGTWKYFCSDYSASTRSRSEPQVGWKNIASNSDGQWYFDETSILKTENSITLWVLNDLELGDSTAQRTEKYQSMKFHLTYDCVARKTAFDEAYFYAGSMGTGRILSGYDKGALKSLGTPTKPSEKEIFEIACEKYK
jgi:hypothetical protein